MATTFQVEDIYINILFSKKNNLADLPVYQSFSSRCNNYVKFNAGLLLNNQPKTNNNQKLGPRIKPSLTLPFIYYVLGPQHEKNRGG